jgi:hypothetical protein
MPQRTDTCVRDWLQLKKLEVTSTEYNISDETSNYANLTGQKNGQGTNSVSWTERYLNERV